MRLHCPVCKKDLDVERTPQDPPGAAVLEIACLDCAPDGPSSMSWRDEAGNLLFGIAPPTESTPAIAQA